MYNFGTLEQVRPENFDVPVEQATVKVFDRMRVCSVQGRRVSWPVDTTAVGEKFRSNICPSWCNPLAHLNPRLRYRREPEPLLHKIAIHTSRHQSS